MRGVLKQYIRSCQINHGRSQVNNPVCSEGRAAPKEGAVQGEFENRSTRKPTVQQNRLLFFVKRSLDEYCRWFPQGFRNLGAVLASSVGAFGSELLAFFLKYIL